MRFFLLAKRNPYCLWATWSFAEKKSFKDEETLKIVKQGVIEFECTFPLSATDQKCRKIVLFASPNICDLVVEVFPTVLLFTLCSVESGTTCCIT